MTEAEYSDFAYAMALLVALSDGTLHQWRNSDGDVQFVIQPKPGFRLKVHHTRRRSLRRKR